MSFQGLYDIRPATAEDKSFIMATFLRGVYYGHTWYEQIPKELFMDAYKKLAEDAWNSKYVQFNIACLKEDPNVILGYSVLSADRKAVLWIFVKAAWRKQGIGRSLLPETIEFTTHLSLLGQQLIKEKFTNIAFNPFYGV